MRRFLSLAVLCVSTLLVTRSAGAQELGVRAGASVEPDQFYFGAHLETPPIADRVHFRPNIEIGVGDHLTLVALNFELVYRFPTDDPWSFYAGGGPALNIFHHDSDSDAEGGFTIVGGVQHRDGLFFEVKAGALDSPNFKVGVGYVFQSR